MTCPYCAADVASAQMPRHARWHRTYGLHGPDCALIGATAATTCSCGLNEAAPPPDMGDL